MSAVHYLSAHRKGADMLVRIQDGKGNRKKIVSKFQPEMYVDAVAGDEVVAHDMKGVPLAKKSFKTMYDCQRWIDENMDVKGYNQYGQKNFVAQFLAHKFQHTMTPDTKKIRCANVDIEVISAYRDEETGEIINSVKFPYPTIEEHTFKSEKDAEKYRSGVNDFYRWFTKAFPDSRVPPIYDMNAAFPITLIQLENNTTKEQMIWGLVEEHNVGKFQYDENDPEIGGKKVTYQEFRTEQELLCSFLNFWRKSDYDAWTGWNIEGFDAPYIVERCKKILGVSWCNMLSPWDIVKPRTIKSKSGNFTTYDFVGIERLDYIDLYKKFTYTTREEYKLDHIAYCEFGDRKLDYSEVKSLHHLYFHDWEKYVRYGIKDICIVSRLDDKLKLLDIVYTLAYVVKCNYADTLGTVNPVNCMIYNELLKKGLRPKLQPRFEGEIDFEGGYVKSVKAGFYSWVLSVDLNSLK